MKRYSISGNQFGGLEITEHADGRWVRYDELSTRAELLAQAELDALTARLESLADPEQKAFPSFADTDWRSLAWKCASTIRALCAQADAAGEPVANVMRAPVPIRAVLYTDTVGGEQACRDDLWAVSTSELNNMADRIAALERERDAFKKCAEDWTAAAARARRPDEWYKPYDEGVMRVMQADLARITDDLDEALSLAHSRALVIERLTKERDGLVMAVARKWPNETRYETALRYINEREAASNNIAGQASAARKEEA